MMLFGSEYDTQVCGRFRTEKLETFLRQFSRELSNANAEGVSQ